jgi:hypothetical protein
MDKLFLLDADAMVQMLLVAVQESEVTEINIVKFAKYSEPSIIQTGPVWPGIDSLHKWPCSK